MATKDENKKSTTTKKAVEKDTTKKTTTKTMDKILISFRILFPRFLFVGKWIFDGMEALYSRI